jgi:hypothetical protein
VPGTAVLALSQYVEVAYADEFLTAPEDVVGGATVLDETHPGTSSPGSVSPRTRTGTGA